jgi:hypothetical protein
MGKSRNKIRGGRRAAELIKAANPGHYIRIAFLSHHARHVKRGVDFRPGCRICKESGINNQETVQESGQQ